MSRLQIALHSLMTAGARLDADEKTQRCKTDGSEHPSILHRGPSLLLIWAYFLGLASVGVVVIGGQFPWFTLAPGITLLLVAYFRYADVKYERDAALEKERAEHKMLAPLRNGFSL